MKKFISLLLIPVLGLLALSCEKEPEQQASGKAVLGISVENLPELVELPQNQSVSYTMYVVAEPGPSDALKVTLAADPAMVDEYNMTMGTGYKMLPEEAYEIVASDLMLMRYNKQSVPGTLKLKGAGCEIGETYLLPIVVDKVQGTAEYEAPLENIVYVFFKMGEAQIEGAGTAASPYIVSDAFTFSKMGNMLKDGETVHVKLSADIDLAGEAWTSVDATGRPIFFDGDNHAIKNVTAEWGLFSNLEGTVQNLTIENANLNLSVEQGGILAHTAGDGNTTVTIKNVTVANSTIVNTGYVGALVGRINKGDVDNVNIDCTVSGSARVAGAFGHAISSTINNTTVAGTVTGTDYYVGGLVGLMYDCTVKNTSASANVTCESLANSYSRIGGLVGQMTAGGHIEKCHATGTVIGKGYFGGGLVGVAEAAETVDGVETVKAIVIKQCYATGNVSLIRDGNAKDAGAGGLVGRFEKGKLEVINCYATGAIEVDRYSSGFVGDVNLGELVITNGFCNGDLSKMGPDAAGNHSDGIAVGCLRTPDSITIKCSGFVAWNSQPEKKFIYQDLVPSAGNYHGTEGTISAQATALGWDTSVWDLSADVPALK